MGASEIGRAHGIAMHAQATSHHARSILLRSIFNALKGNMVEALGWEIFFHVCTLLAIPGMFLLFKVAPWNTTGSDHQKIESHL